METEIKMLRAENKRLKDQTDSVSYSVTMSIKAKGVYCGNTECRAVKSSQSCEGQVTIRR